MSEQNPPPQTPPIDAAKMAQWGRLLKKSDLRDIQAQLTPYLDDPFFWNNHWPILLKKSIKLMDAHSVMLLLELRPTDGSTPPLPTDFLNTLYPALGQSAGMSEFWGKDQIEQLAQRLVQSPQRFSFSNLSNLCKTGGWKWGHNMEEMEHILPQAAWYQQAQTQWLKTTSGRRQVIAALTDLSQGLSQWDSTFGTFFPYISTHYQIPLINQISQTLCEKDTQDLNKLNKIADIYLKLRKHNSLEDTSWPQWWSQRAQELWKFTRTSAILEKLLQNQEERSGDLPFVWTDQHSEVWGKTLGSYLIPKHQDPVDLKEKQKKACLAIVKIESLLSNAGVWEQHSEKFQQALESQCPDWKQYFLQQNEMISDEDPLWTRKRSELQQELLTDIAAQHRTENATELTRKYKM